MQHTWAEAMASEALQACDNLTQLAGEHARKTACIRRAADLRAPPEGFLRHGRVREDHSRLGGEAAQAQQRVHAHDREQRVPHLGWDIKGNS
jgi:hypothetical protein